MTLSAGAKPQFEVAREYPPPGEQAHIDSLIRELRAKMTREYEQKRILRDAHPKMHGCVQAEFRVEQGLPEDLAVGILATPRTFPAWVRFSNQNGTVSSDNKGDIRGVAIKLMGVKGPKLAPDVSSGANQDFILISASRFVTKDVAEFDGLVKGLTGGKIKLLWYFLTHWRVARNLWFSLRKHTSPLEIRYFSVAPYLLGRHAVKYSLTPRSSKKTPIPSRPSEDYLREAMVEKLSRDDVEFDFAIQLQVDPARQPIEDPGITWSEELFPFRKVATLRVPAQAFDTPERRLFGDNLSFNPWRCLAEHRPLGGISRARKQVYDTLSAFRHERNQVPRTEPSTSDPEWTGARSADP